MLFKTKTGADEAEDLSKKKKKKGLESGVRSGAYTKASGYKKLLKEAGEY